MDLIPQPKQLHLQPGSLDLGRIVAITVGSTPDERVKNAAKELARLVGRATGSGAPRVQSGVAASGTIHLAATDPSSRAESYRLTVSPDRVLVSAEGPAGLFYGLQTLSQIIATRGTAIPCVEIADVADFPHRGILHDVTRGKVPTLETLKGLASRLASYKINQLQLYIEHSFAFETVPEFRRFDPITAGEIRALDGYCRERFIDLVPTLATFGHLYELLRLPRFEHLNELDIRASELPLDLWDRMAHYTIDCRNPESFALIRRLLDEFLPLFSSNLCNICCDETFDLGNGRNRDYAGKAGKGRLYVDFVKELIGVVRSHGKTPMIWGDIMLNHPELIGELPEDVFFLDWGYSPQVTDTSERLFAEKKRRHYACPGVMGWSRFANDIAGAGENIGRMVRFGRENGAEGILTTDWGDCGHVNLLAASRHGMALGADLSWNIGSYRDHERFDAALSQIEWGDRSGAIARLLRELGSLCPYHFGNIYAWVNGLESLWNREAEIDRLDPADLDRKAARAGEIAAELAKLPGDRLDIGELTWGAEAVAWTLKLLVAKRTGQVIEAGPGLAAAGRELVRRFERLWRARNKESELWNVTETFEKVFEKLGVPDPQVEQAGAIAIKPSETGRLVLLVRAKKNPAHWIFPKGHIDPGENAEQAAVRELLEEAGVEGRIRAPAGDERFRMAEKTYHVRYFTVEYLSTGGPGEPGRTPTWCTFEEAMNMLSFEAAREMLKRQS